MRDAGLDCDIEVFDTEPEHSVHASEVDRDAPLDGIDVTLERRAGTKGNHRCTHACRCAQDSTDLVCRDWIDDDVRLPRGVPRFTVAMVLELGGVGRTAVAEQRPQLGEQRGTTFRA
jgi:hypothetical protein